ncbi:MAG: fumarate reductase/succinate dehydrogenase flavoprotein subunit, partial [Longimicrobiales bacterium]
GRVDAAQVEAAAREALAPFERGGAGDGSDGPFQIQAELQDGMQDLVGIVRRANEIDQALERIAALRARAARVAVPGNRAYNPGWHTALDLKGLLTVAEAITRSAADRRESRGAHFREDYPAKDDAAGRLLTVIRRGPDGEMRLARAPLREPPAELQAIIREMK